MTTLRYRILALDIDGTILDRDGNLRPGTIRAIGRYVEAGAKVILCTGRRYRRALPIAERLGLDTPLVCNSGALVKQTQGHQTLWRADLPVDVLSPLFELFRHRDEPAVSFTDRPPDGFDFLVHAAPTGRPLFDDYLDQNTSHAEVDPAWTNRDDLAHYHLCAIGERSTMLDFEQAVLERLPGLVQTFVQKSPRYAGTMCEILRHDANKWTALARLAESWQIEANEVCAVGDDMNDLPMIRAAGLGVAMGQAVAEVRNAADLVTGSENEDGVAQLIDDVLLA